MIRSPLFSRWSSPSTTTTISPRAIASTATDGVERVLVLGHQASSAVHVGDGPVGDGSVRQVSRRSVYLAITSTLEVHEVAGTAGAEGGDRAVWG